jgi:probable HAF family extracellular repeat protein
LGGYDDAMGYHCFVKDGDKYTSFDYPGASSTNPGGMNNSGQIVGYYLDSSYIAHGFLKDGGTYTSFDHPGAGSWGTIALDINDSGQIVGYYWDSSGVTHSFLKEGDKYTPIVYPAAIETCPVTIIGSGQIVGFYADAEGNQHGFMATPNPVPTFQDILDFFDKSVNDGVLSGVGSTPQASTGRMWALRNMIVQAKIYKEAGHNRLSCNQLMDAYNKTDGLPNPDDFVSGPAASQLAQMILDIKASLGSP